MMSNKIALMLSARNECVRRRSLCLTPAFAGDAEQDVFIIRKWSPGVIYE